MQNEISESAIFNENPMNRASYNDSATLLQEQRQLEKEHQKPEEEGEVVSQGQESEKSELIRITIDLGADLPPENIVVRRGQEREAESLARAFCQKHGFDRNIEMVLRQQIDANIRQMLAEQDKEAAYHRGTLSRIVEDPVVAESSNTASPQKVLRMDKVEENKESAILSPKSVSPSKSALSKSDLNTPLTQKSSAKPEAQRAINRQRLKQRTEPGSMANKDLMLLQGRGSATTTQLNQVSTHNVDQLSYDGGKENLLNHKQLLAGQSHVLSDDPKSPNHGRTSSMADKVSREKLLAVVGDNTRNEFDKLRRSGSVSRSSNGAPNIVCSESTDVKILKTYHNMLGDHPSYQPKINDVSRIIAQSKKALLARQGHRQNVFDRLHQQETISKKIANDIKQGKDVPLQLLDLEVRLQHQRPQSQQKMTGPHQTSISMDRANRSVQRFSKSIEKHQTSMGLDQSHNHSRDVTGSPNQTVAASKLRQPMGEAFENPGERLYRTGVQANREKRRLIEEVRRELEDREVRDHCTFKPKLTAYDFYKHGNYMEQARERKQGEVPNIEVEQLQEDIGGTEFAPDRSSQMHAGTGNQMFMPQGDDDDLFDDVDDEQPEAAALRPQGSFESLGDGCCTGEVPSEQHDYLAQPVPQNQVDTSFERHHRARKPNEVDTPDLSSSLNASVPKQRPDFSCSFGGRGPPNRCSTVQSFGAHHEPMQKEDLTAANDSKFQALYNDAKYRNMRKEQIYANCLDQECTFKPSLITKGSKVSQTTVKKAREFLNERSRERERLESSLQLDAMAVYEGQIRPKRPASSFVNSGVETPDQRVFERMARNIASYQNRQKAAEHQKMLNEVVDPNTGKEFFRPEINRNVAVRNRPASAAQAVETLHLRHKQLQEKRKKAAQELDDEIVKRRKNAIRANATSDKIVQQAKVAKLQEIFNKLDSDGDGLISTPKIDTKPLDGQLSVIFRPLLNELEALSEPLNCEEFVDASLRLYDTLNQSEKNALMKFGKKVAPDQQPPLPPSNKFSFKPVINKDYQTRSTRAVTTTSVNRPASKGSSRPQPQMKRQALKKEMHGKKSPLPPTGKRPNMDLKSRVAQLTGSTRAETALRPGIEQYIREYGSFGGSGTVKRAASAATAEAA